MHPMACSKMYLLSKTTNIIYKQQSSVQNILYRHSHISRYVIGKKICPMIIAPAQKSRQSLKHLLGNSRRISLSHITACAHRTELCWDLVRSAALCKYQI